MMIATKINKKLQIYNAHNMSIFYGVDLSDILKIGSKMLLIFCSEIDSLIDNKLLCLKKNVIFFPFTGVFENNTILHHYVCYHFVFCYWHLFFTSNWAIVEKSYQTQSFLPFPIKLLGFISICLCQWRWHVIA